MTNRLRIRPPSAIAPAAALAAALAACAASAAGLDVHTDVDVAAIGLPVYPGAVKKSDGDGSAPGISFGVWGGPFGLKLAALSFHSADDAEAVAKFYRDALAKYGPVLDCSDNKPRNGAGHRPGASVDIDSGKSAKDKPVTCGDDAAELTGERIYKVGTQADQRMVDVKPQRAGANFQMVRIEMRGAD